ncbi:MAG: amidohydrolase family protein [Planctomycetota bacterium]
MPDVLFTPYPFRGDCQPARSTLLLLALGATLFLTSTKLTAQPFSTSWLSGGVLIRDATILTAPDQQHAQTELGSVLIDDGKIKSIGSAVNAPVFARVIDGKGKFVAPGFIDIDSTLAMTTTGSSVAQLTARAEDGFDRFDRDALVGALKSGVTCVYLRPGPALGFAGLGALVRLAAEGSTSVAIGQVLQTEADLFLNLGATQRPIARVQLIAAVRKQLDEARDYRRQLDLYQEELTEYEQQLAKRAAEAKTAGDANVEKKVAGTDAPIAPLVATDLRPAQDAASAQDLQNPNPMQAPPSPVPSPTPPDGSGAGAAAAAPAKDAKAELKKPTQPPRREDLRILLRALDREIPVRCEAHRSSDILNALELADRYGLRLILTGATEAHLVAKEIAAREVPVVLGPLEAPLDMTDELLRRVADNAPALLRAAGVAVWVGSGAEPFSSRALLGRAAMAEARGSGVESIAMVTSAAAALLGVDSVGDLRVGARADFVVWSGDPREPGAVVERVFVGGIEVYVRTETAF